MLRATATQAPSSPAGALSVSKNSPVGAPAPLSEVDGWQERLDADAHLPIEQWAEIWNLEGATWTLVVWIASLPSR